MTLRYPTSPEPSSHAPYTHAHLYLHGRHHLSPQIIRRILFPCTHRTLQTMTLTPAREVSFSASQSLSMVSQLLLNKRPNVFSPTWAPCQRSSSRAPYSRPKYQSWVWHLASSFQAYSQTQPTGSCQTHWQPLNLT